MDIKLLKVPTEEIPTMLKNILGELQESNVVDTKEELPKEVQEEIDVQEEKLDAEPKEASLIASSANNVSSIDTFWCGNREDLKILDKVNPLEDFNASPVRPDVFTKFDICMCNKVTDNRKHSSLNGLHLSATLCEAFLYSPLLTKPLIIDINESVDESYYYLIHIYKGIISYDVMALYTLLKKDKLEFTLEAEESKKSYIIEDFDDFIITETPTFNGTQFVGSDVYSNTPILFTDSDDFNRTEMFKQLIAERMEMTVSGLFLLKDENA